MTDRSLRLDALLELFWKSRPPGALCCISALLGLLYVASLFDVGFLLGNGEYWQTIVGDRAQHVAGYFYYLQDDWRFPVFFTQNYNYPDGVNIIFTDSVPIVSLIVKCLRAWLPPDFNVFGLWLAACYVLQGVSITALVAAWGQRNVATATAATLLALSLPAFLVRVHLASLPAHFLIIGALVLYFHFVRDKRLGAALWWFPILLLCSLLVHPYLFVMVFAVFAAAIAQRILIQSEWLRSALAYCVGVGLTLAVTMFVTGYIGSGAERGKPTGFGAPENALDVLAPVLPEGSGLMRWGGDIVSFGADYYNYFGGGILLLVAVHLIISRTAIVHGARRHLLLFLVLAGFTVFAISSTIRVAGAEIASYQIPGFAGWLVSQFRASARFFWPATYVILAAVVAMTGRRFRGPIGTLLLTAAVVLQLLDTAPVRATIARTTKSGEFERNLLDRAAWSNLISRHDGVQVYPSFPCRPWEEEHLRNFDLALQLLTARSNVRMNSLYISGNRSRSTKNCALERDGVVDLKPTPRDLFVFFSDHYSSALVRRLFPDGTCRLFDLGFVCTQQWSTSQPGPDLADFSTIESPRFYRLGSPIDFRTGGDSRGFLAGGWLMPEAAGSRLDGPNAYIELPLADPVRAALNLSLLTFPVESSRSPPVIDVSVLLGGAVIGDLHVDTRQPESHTLAIPAELTADRSALTLELRARDQATGRHRLNQRLNLGVRSLTMAIRD